MVYGVYNNKVTKYDIFFLEGWYSLRNFKKFTLDYMISKKHNCIDNSELLVLVLDPAKQMKATLTRQLLE